MNFIFKDIKNKLIIYLFNVKINTKDNANI
jgi:hypothetical protein